MLVLLLFLLPGRSQAQSVIYSSYPIGGDYVVNNQMCCYGVSRIGWFQYHGERAKLHTLSLDAWMYYSGSLEVSFLRWNAPGDYSILDSWSGTTFDRSNPLEFVSEVDVLGGQILGVRVTVLPGLIPDPQTIASAAVWQENLTRESLWSYTSYVYEVTAYVDEPATTPLLLLSVGILAFARERARSGSNSSPKDRKLYPS